MNTDGTVSRYKARLCAKGYTQQKGKDYFDTFAPVARTTSMRVILAIAAHEGLELESIDIDNAFLNSVIDANIYMTQPEGFVDPRYPDTKKWVCKLQKGLYGIKQASRLWHATIVHMFKSWVFRSPKQIGVFTSRKLITGG